MASLRLVVFVSALLAGFCEAGTQKLRVTTIKEEPYAMAKGSEFEGFCMDMLSTLSKKLNFKYDVQLVKDGRYGREDEAGNWNGMIGEIIRGEADLAVAPLTVLSKRESVVEMSKPFLQTGISFILRKDLATNNSHIFSLFNLFSTEMWIGILVSYLLTSVCIFLVCRISPCEWEDPEKNTFTLSHSLWYTMGALTLQGADPHPRAPSGRLISSVWWLFSLVLFASYFANLSLWLHSDQQEMTIKTFEDLANQNAIEYGTIKDSSTFNFFKNSNNPTYHRMYEHMRSAQSGTLSAEEGFRRAQKGNFAFIGEAVSLDLAVAKYCNLTRAPEIISARSYSIAGPLGSPLMKNVSVAVLQMSESGDLSYLRSKWWASSCLSADAQHSSLKLSSLRGIFLLLACGLSLGLFMALLELAARSRKNAQEQQKSCCSVWSSELGQRFRRVQASAETSEKA